MKLDKTRTKAILLIVGLVILMGVSASAISRPAPVRTGGDRGGDEFSLSPQPATMDQITHNTGNIVTTIDNFGNIGGWHYYGRPSCEWPRNSGHDYMGEALYWIGVVTPAGDTIVVDTHDDFQAVPMPVNGVDDYRIYLSTDTTRYFDYDPSDTTGTGIDCPANGWRVWNATTDTFAYNQSYDPLAAAYAPGGPTSMQESHYRFNDAASGNSLLGLEFTQTILQWNYCYNEDIMFVELEIHNASATDYTDFAFGLYSDIDVGGFDGTGENGRLGDLTNYDLTRDLAWMYDLQGWDAGWGPEEPTGLMGTRILKTPQDIGVTAVRTGEWEELGDANDKLKFEYLNSTQVDDQTIPRDLLYIQCVRGIDLPAGSTIEIVYAIVAGQTEDELVTNSDMAATLFAANYVGPEPPPIPTLSARASNGKVYLHWDAAAELGLDPMSGENDFAGYKLYRSDNQGKTWGQVDDQNTNECLSIDYKTIALYSVADPADPIPHTFVDAGLYNGVEYWYCLAAFDLGDEGAGVDVLQSGFGVAGQAINVVACTPRTNPAGFISAAATVALTHSGDELIPTGQVIPTIYDESATLGSEYSVVFEDGATGTTWHLINVTTGDTVLADQTNMSVDPELCEIAEGIQVIVLDAEHEPAMYGQTAFSGNDTTLAIGSMDGPVLTYWTGNEVHAFGSAQYRPTYEIRYSTDSTLAVSMWEGFDGVPYAKSPVPFEVWNMTTNQRVSLGMDEWPIDGVWSPGEGLFIIDYPYDPVTDLIAEAFPYLFGWRIEIESSNYAPAAGDILSLGGAPLFGPNDSYTFKIDGVNSASARANLKNIKVVPNPYYAHYSSMVETGEGESVLTFNNVPDECTIRIYTLAGDLVKTIVHNDGLGEAVWNLQSMEQIQIASGIYLFHVESPYGEHLGRFAIIK